MNEINILTVSRDILEADQPNGRFCDIYSIQRV